MTAEREVNPTGIAFPGNDSLWVAVQVYRI